MKSEPKETPAERGLIKQMEKLNQIINDTVMMMDNQLRMEEDRKVQERMSNMLTVYKFSMLFECCLRLGVRVCPDVLYSQMQAAAVAVEAMIPDLKKKQELAERAEQNVSADVANPA